MVKSLIYVQIIDPRWRSMFKSNRSFMSISKQGSELCSQLVIYNVRPGGQWPQYRPSGANITLGASHLGQY